MPGNRWDEVAGERPHPLPQVSVIVTHFEQPGELARTLAALARQDYPPDRVQVIVADDGSSTPPSVPAGIELVRHDDRGFRAAAVRNLGVRRAGGEVLCFLDADTSPEPGYVRRISRLPALLPEAVTVGRRRHADLSSEPADAAIEAAGPAHRLDEPAWLAEAYTRSRDLLDADDRSYRYVIGAAFSCSRWFFHEIGGFDEGFDEYGGEDWEWAHRAWQHGAVLAHVPEAIAWHDGPDWAARFVDPAERIRQGNVQSLLLSRAIPVDGSRGRGLLAPVADVVVRVRGRHADAATFVCVDSVLTVFPRARVELEHGASGPLFAHDPRVVALHGGAPEGRVVIELSGPVAFPRDKRVAALLDRIRSLGAGEEGELSIRSADAQTLGHATSRRARERCARWGTGASFATGTIAVEGALVLGDEPRVAAWVDGWADQTPQRLEEGEP